MIYFTYLGMFCTELCITFYRDRIFNFEVCLIKICINT